MSLFDLSGKTAIITGASRGIGKAIAIRMAEQGANVVVSSRKGDACDLVTNEINEKFPGRAKTIVASISDKPALQNLVDETVAHFGGLDILVCNAAVNPYFGPAEECPDDAFDKILSSNVKSNHWLSNMVLPHMRKAGGGSIIIISSIAGLLGQEMIGAYGISKAADMALARNLAAEHGKDNIRANAVVPGLIKTDFSKALWDNEKILERAVAGSPLKRIGQVDEIAGAVVFLAGESGSFMTGQSMVIDGGETISHI